MENGFGVFDNGDQKTASSGERSLVSVWATVMLFDNETKRWVASAGFTSGLSKVEVLQNTFNNSYRVLAIRTDNNEASLNCSVTRGLVYNSANPIFHQWKEEGRIVGLHFNSEDEARQFASTIDFALDRLNSGGYGYSSHLDGGGLRRCVTPEPQTRKTEITSTASNVLPGAVSATDLTVSSPPVSTPPAITVTSPKFQTSYRFVPKSNSNAVNGLSSSSSSVPSSSSSSGSGVTSEAHHSPELNENKDNEIDGSKRAQYQPTRFVSQCKPTEVTPQDHQPASVASQYQPSVATQYQPSVFNQYQPSVATQYQPASVTSQYQPSVTSQYQPSVTTQYQPSVTPQYQPSVTTQYQPSVSSQYEPSVTPQYQPTEESLVPQDQPSEADMQQQPTELAPDASFSSTNDVSQPDTSPPTSQESSSASSTTCQAPPAPPPPPPPPPPPVCVPKSSGDLGSALQGAQLRKSPRPDEDGAGGSLVRSASPSVSDLQSDMMSEMARKLKERMARAASVGAGGGGGTPAAGASPVSTPQLDPVQLHERRPSFDRSRSPLPFQPPSATNKPPSALAQSDSPKFPRSKRIASLTGQESTTPSGNPGNQSIYATSAELDAAKQEIMSYVRTEISRAKQEIIDAVRLLLVNKN